MKSSPTVEMVFKKTLVSIVAFISILVVSPAMAAIYAQVDGPAVPDITNFEDFESFDGSEAPAVLPSGFTFDCATCDFSNYFGGLDGKALYQNGGSTSMTSIQLTSGANFAAVSMTVGNGWGPNDPQVAWVRAYNNGLPVISFPFPAVPLAATITVWADGGSEFDEVRIQAYRGTDTINEDEAQYGAVAIDDVTAGSIASMAPMVPVPTLSHWALILLTVLLGVVAFSHRRIRS
jgi:hypothetical protein